MGALDTVLSTAGGALSVTAGVVLGAVLARRSQDRHWLRDKQLAAYQALLTEYATFVMILKRAHSARAHWDYDWAVWSAALTSASLVAPVDVARALDAFGSAVNAFLGAASLDARTDALSDDEFAAAMVAPAAAQVTLVNAIRRSLDRSQGRLSVPLGGSLAPPPADQPGS
jgi:hypothetical protein